MFIIVKSGDEQERLFNTNCQIDALLRDITNRCPHKVEDEENYLIDLMDEDGRALALHTKKPTTLGCDILQERSVYLLVLVKTDPKGRFWFEPLFDHLDNKYSELKDAFGIEALDNLRKRLPQKTSGKKSKLIQQDSHEKNGSATPSASLSAVNALAGGFKKKKGLLGALGAMKRR